MSVPDRAPDRAEQMALFRTESLGDGTTRGSYFSDSDGPDQRVDSAARVVGSTPRRVAGDTAGGVPYSDRQLTPPKNSFVYGETHPGVAPQGVQPYPLPTESLKDGGRAHMAGLKGTFAGNDAMAHWKSKTDFGDNSIRATPYQFGELEQRWTGGGDTVPNTSAQTDDYGMHSWWTPDNEQVTGLEVETSDVLPSTQVIAGAGTGSAFRGHGYGVQAAATAAIQNLDAGTYTMGNSFSADGHRAFEKKGAVGEDTAEYAIEDRARELAQDDADYMSDEELEGYGYSAEHSPDDARELWAADNEYGYRDSATMEVRDNLFEQQRQQLNPLRGALGQPGPPQHNPPRTERMFRSTATHDETGEPLENVKLPDDEGKPFSDVLSMSQFARDPEGAARPNDKPWASERRATRLPSRGAR